MRFIIGGNGGHHTLLLVTNLKIVRVFCWQLQQSLFGLYGIVMRLNQKRTLLNKKERHILGFKKILKNALSHFCIDQALPCLYNCLKQCCNIKKNVRHPLTLGVTDAWPDWFCTTGSLCWEFRHIIGHTISPQENDACQLQLKKIHFPTFVLVYFSIANEPPRRRDGGVSWKTPHQQWHL